MDDVIAGEADICVYGLGETLHTSGLAYTALFDDDEYCMMSRQRDLASLEKVTPADLAGYQVVMPLLGYSEASDAHYAYAREHEAEGYSTRTRTGLDESVLVQMVATDTKLVAIRLEHHMRTFPGLVSLPFEGFLRAPIVLAYRPEHKAVVDDFVAVARDSF